MRSLPFKKIFFFSLTIFLTLILAATLFHNLPTKVDAQQPPPTINVNGQNQTVEQFCSSRPGSSTALWSCRQYTVRNGQPFVAHPVCNGLSGTWCVPPPGQCAQLYQSSPAAPPDSFTLNCPVIAPSAAPIASVANPSPVAASPASSPVISSFTVNPTTINNGGTTTLNWSSTGATVCAIGDNLNPVMSGLAVSGTRASNAYTGPRTVNFTLTCQAGGVLATKTATLTVNASAVAAPSVAPSQAPAATVHKPTATINTDKTTLAPNEQAAIRIDAADQDGDLKDMKVYWAHQGQADFHAFGTWACSGGSCRQTQPFALSEPGIYSIIVNVNETDPTPGVANKCSGNYIDTAWGHCSGNDRVDITVTSPVIPPPSVPTLTAVPSCSGLQPLISVSWTSSPGATQYTLYRNGQGAGYYTQTSLPTDTSVVAGGTYTYQVSASGTGGVSAQSAAVSATTTDCSQQINLAHSVTCNPIGQVLVTLGWSGQTGNRPVIQTSAPIVGQSANQFGVPLNSSSFTAAIANGSNFSFVMKSSNDGFNITSPVFTSNTVQVQKSDCRPQPPTVTCNPGYNAAVVGNLVGWGANASGGSGQYTYSWISDDSEVNGQTSNPVSIVYRSSGTKSASVKVHDTVTGLETTQACASSMDVTYGSCAGFMRNCNVTVNGASVPGTQWCANALESTPGSCDIVDPNHTVCYLEPGSNVQGCKPDNAIGDCTSFSPQGLINTGQRGDGGAQIYKTGDFQGKTTWVAPLIVVKGSTNSTVDIPNVTPGDRNAFFSPDTNRDGEWVVNIPANQSVTTDQDYLISDSVTSHTGRDNAPGNCPNFIIRVPKAVEDTSCPSTIRSTEARIKTSGLASDNWATQKTVTIGQSVLIGGFHENQIDTTSPGVKLAITGPQGASSVTTYLYDGSTSAAEWNNQNFGFTPTLPGTYTINATTLGKVGSPCAGTASLVVTKKAVVTIQYRVASTPEGLNSATWHPYTQEPTVVDWKLTEVTPGAQNFIWVEYEDSEGKKTRENISINFVGEDPTITDTACSLGINGSLFTVTIKGDNFGTSKGTVSVNNKEASVDWDNQLITGQVTLDNIQNIQNQTHQIVVTRPDGVVVKSTCKIGVSQLSLGANIFCRNENNKEVGNIKATLQDTAVGGTPLAQTVSIDKNGVVQGLTTPLQAGKQYRLSIQAPKSLRRVVTFTAGTGTTTVPNFALPIGDIFPLAIQDGKINSADKAELNREWLAGPGSAAAKPGDFNEDSKVNSVDWACMRFDFGKENDLLPTTVVSSPTPRPSTSGSPLPSASPLPSVTTSASPVPSASI